uniref:Translation initiation factor eIF2B subunit epsilon n=1 Tax=Hirondellea gigas TaxID=1518452 RepID=A0A6A7G7T2_9CRUS
MTRKKRDSHALPSEFEEELQAVVLADSFNSRFVPITLETPKVLMPLVNVPLLDYTLEFLAAGEVKEIYILCHSHSNQIEEYIRESSWSDDDECVVHVLKLDNVYGTGDALRAVHQADVIRSDPFVLVSADVVANVDLQDVIKQHRLRSSRDSRNILTSVFKRASPNHRTRSPEDELVLALSPTPSSPKRISSDGGRLLAYDNTPMSDHISFDVSLFEIHPDVTFRFDLMDCFIDVCSPKVLELFADNFDYQHLRSHFLKGVLESEILGLNVHTYVVETDYAARVPDLRTYDSVSKDIVQRWAYPICPDNNVFGESTFKFHKDNIYREQNVIVDRTANIGRNTVLGENSKIGAYSSIENSVIGRNCVIGNNVTLNGTYLWDNCVIEDDCTIEDALLCTNVSVGAGSTISRGALLSFNVVIGRGHHVKPYQAITTVDQTDDGWDDDDNESSGLDSSQSRVKDASEPIWKESDVGVGGIGRIFHRELADDDKVDPHMNSIAVVPDEKSTADSHQRLQHASPSPRSEDPISFSDIDEPQTSAVDDPSLANTAFVNEVSFTIQRGENGQLDVESIVLEIKSLKLSSNIVDITDFSAAIFIGIFSCVDPQPSNTEKFSKKMLASVKRLCEKWNVLISRFTRLESDQLKAVYGLEQACSQNSFYRPFFEHVLHHLYDLDTLSEESILLWWDEQSSKLKSLSEDEKLLVNQATEFVSWLREAESEDSSDED